MPETALLFLVCYVAALAGALFINPSIGLYTYIAVFYLHPPSRWWGTFLPDLRWSLVVAVVTLIAVVIHADKESTRPSWYRLRLAQLLIAYTVWMWFQAPWVQSPWHLDGAVLFTKYIMLFFLMHAIVNDNRSLKNFLFANVIGSIYFGFLVYLAPDAGRLEGVGGPGVDSANALGIHLAATLMFAAFLILSCRGWKRLIVIGGLPFIVNGIIQTETRAAIAGLVVGGLATVYLKPSRFRRIYYAMAVMAMVGFLALANETFLGRISEAVAAASGETEWDTSALSRLDIVRAQVEMFRDHPLGVGHQGTAALSRQYMPPELLTNKGLGYRSSHNTIMSVVVDQGVIGVIILLWITTVLLRSLRYVKRLDKRGLPFEMAMYRTAIGGALVTVVTAGMFTPLLKSEALMWCIFLVALLPNIASRATSCNAPIPPQQVEDRAKRANKTGHPAEK